MKWLKKHSPKQLSYTLYGLISLFALIGGCQTALQEIPPYTPKKIEVLRKTEKYNIGFPLTVEDKHLLTTWLAPYNRRHTHLRIGSKSLTRHEVRQLMDYLKHLGFEETHLSEDATLESNNPTTKVIAVDAYTIILPGCPDWSTPLGHNIIHQPHSNFGCADALALAQMIDDPKDLYEGRDIGTFDGNAAQVSMNHYHNDTVKVYGSGSSSSSAGSSSSSGSNNSGYNTSSGTSNGTSSTSSGSSSSSSTSSK